MKCSIHISVIGLVLLFAGCQKNASHQDDQVSQDEVEHSPNQELYDQVMGIHDEVMPKMNDLHKAKTSLKTRLEMPGLDQKDRQQIESQIARIDSASEGMMVWMRQFDPLPDSDGEDSARAYLENELKKIEKVRDNIHAALKTGAGAD